MTRDNTDRCAGQLRHRRATTPLRSAEYVTITYTERLAEAGIQRSVGSYENALAKTGIILFKTEAIHRQGLEQTYS